MLNLDSDPSALFEYERQMRINEDIIRFLTIKINEKWQQQLFLRFQNYHLM